MPEIRTCIVGSKFQGRHALRTVDELREGDSIELQRDPYNAHDRNAVLCVFRDYRLGFVPRVAAPKIAAAIDSGRAVIARVHQPARVKRGIVAQEPGITVKWDD